jgi:hypothetical protein
MPRKKLNQPPEEIERIRNAIRTGLNELDDYGRRIGSYKWGVYAFFDYDGEPIYVGQTYEKISGRIGRHLTNQRTDAVAMNVLDPFEVYEIEVWPLAELGEAVSTKRSKKILDFLEYAIFQTLVTRSKFKAVLNEKTPIPVKLKYKLPKSFRFQIVPDDIYQRRKHKDVRIARRAQTISGLAKVISERQVDVGLRRTLLTQAKRLANLAEERASETNNG